MNALKLKNEEPSCTVRSARVYSFPIFDQIQMCCQSGLAANDDTFNCDKDGMTAPQFMRTASNQVYYYHNDHLGTPQALVDREGNLVWQADYQAFGKADIKISSVENNLRFPGQYYDSETPITS